MDVTRSELRFLKWLGTFCAPLGTEVNHVSTVIGALTRKKLIAREGKRVRLMGTGVDALLNSGWIPGIDGTGGGHACACPCHTTDVRHKLKCCPPDAVPR